ncbi:MAG: endonuclease III domain-containing protein [Candidatus Bathyarchaeia archaeon]
MLIRTILSQNTSDVNRDRAFNKLAAEFDIQPNVLADLSEEQVKRSIKMAGLGNIKARRLISVAAEVCNRFHGDIAGVLRLPVPQARMELMGIEGIGPKTADIMLAFGAAKPVVPVDTHLFTIASRLGLVQSRNYEAVRAAYERAISPGQRVEGHMLFIELGKSVCTAKKPKCVSCPISELCPKIGVETAK